MTPQPRRVSGAAWGFLVVSGALLLASLVLASSDLPWLQAERLNPLSLRQLPRAFQVDSLWVDALPPVVLAGLAAAAACGCRAGAGATAWPSCCCCWWPCATCSGASPR